jgi:hypothetical protein
MPVWSVDVSQDLNLGAAEVVTELQLGDVGRCAEALEGVLGGDGVVDPI